MYKVTLRVNTKVFTKFEPALPLDKKTANSVRLRLFKQYSLPVIFREGSFYIFGNVTDKEMEIQLGEGERVILENKGSVDIQGFRNEEEVQHFLKDMVEAHDLHRIFAEEQMRKNRTRLRSKLGEIYLIPYLVNRVFKRENDYLLMVDVYFRLVLKHSLQELLEKGIITPSELKEFRLKPRGYDFTSRAKDVKRASELGREFINNMLKTSSGITTRKHWKAILENPGLFERAFVVFLENNYVYPASMLNIVIDFDNVEEDIAEKLVKLLKLSPEERINLIREALKKYRGALTPWGISISNREELVDGKIHYNNILVDARGKTSKVETNIRHFLKHLRPFIKHPDINTFVLTVDKEYDKQLIFNREQFLEELKEFLNNKGINLLIKGKVRITARKRSEALKKFTDLIEELKDYDLVIIFLEEYGKIDPYTQEVLLYDYLKRKLLEHMTPSQVILNTTLRRKPAKGWEFILLNVAEQIMAKTGNFPYKIKGEIGGADYFVGIDISRITRGNTVNVGAFTKIFAKDGTFLRYKILAERTFGESISRKAVQELFLTLREMRIKDGSRIVIHRDGRFQGDETRSFVELSKEFNYRVELVEIIKRGNPRIFPAYNPKIKGDYYKLGERSLILATCNNIYRGTHQPLRINKVHGELPVETLASQVLSLTLMNYSSFQPIKLPATTHYADKITKLLLRGIEPSRKEGDIMYWL
ncbi:Piwi domain-containing protein [Aquifex sp.]